MKIYFAGAEAFPEMLHEEGCKFLMAYPSKKIIEWKNKTEVFVDSGAFSVFTGKKTINHQAYIDFIKDIDVEIYASLDVIGSARQSKENVVEELKQGLTPIPTFHSGEPLDYLDYYMDNFDFISLGGLVGGSIKSIMLFLDKCWNRIAQKNRTLKVHAFGVMSYKILSTYPFYSCDGTSWMLGSQRGNAMTVGDGVSEYVGQIHMEEGDKITDTFGPNFLNFVHHNKTPEERTKRGNIRNRHNVRQYLKMQKQLTELWQKRGINWDG